MKQSLRQKQKFSLALTPLLQKQIKLLSLSGSSLRAELEKIISEFPEEEDKAFKHFKDEILIDKYREFLRGKNFSSNLDTAQVATKDIRGDLLEQLMLLNIKDYQYLIGEYIIDSIEAEGRLDPEIDFNDIQKFVKENVNLKIRNDDIEEVIKLIQDLEPPGCAYRSITESLEAQIRNKNISSALRESSAEAIKKISTQELELEELDPEIQTILKELNFNPGLKIETDQDSYTRADVLAIKKNNEWFVSLNDSYMPSFLMDRINSQIDSSSTKSDVKSMMKGIERRQRTLLLVSEYLVKKQINFLNSTSDLMPITLIEIAKSIGMSESTISRIVKCKYIQLPDKLITLNKLLQRKVNRGSDGEDVSPTRLIELIKLNISKEDKNKPFSDESLRLLLKNLYSINIARRTITKYREEAQISSSRSRK
jgi:RNA polymerase sigma-54 factor